MRTLQALFLSAALLCSPATQANTWTAVGLFDIGTFYVDLDNVTHVGDHRKVWTSLDYRNPQTNQHSKKPYKSTRMQMEFDCKDQTVRSLSLSYHAGVRLSGEVLSTEGVIGPFEPVPPETPIFKIMRLVC
ncbi:MAG: hypothetical protein RLZZ457_121 [Pseudomonadota bacterium]